MLPVTLRVFKTIKFCAQQKPRSIFSKLGICVSTFRNMLCSRHLQHLTQPSTSRSRCHINARSTASHRGRIRLVPKAAAEHPQHKAEEPSAQHHGSQLVSNVTQQQFKETWVLQAQQLLRKGAALAAAVAVVSLLAPHAAHAAAAAAAEEGSLVKTAISFILHLDKHMSAMIQQHGPATYAILWTIVFCETGLVLTPFLPGDSLLFAAGAFAGMGQLNISLLFAVFMTSAVLGDAVNYAIGNKLGRWALEKQLLKQKYIDQTEAFYAKYGGKTVVLARFVPIVRTFAPFVAGIGSMAYSKFAMYNVGGALLWTVLFLGAGFFFGNLPVVQHNFTLVVLGIVAVSVLPVVLEVMAARKGHGDAAAGGAAS